MSMVSDATSTASPGWAARAACRGTDLVLWFGPADPEDGSGGRVETPMERKRRERQAKQYCGSCPVREACLADELRFPLTWQWGVRGGLTEQERRELIRRQGRGYARPPVVAPTLTRRAS